MPVLPRWAPAGGFRGQQQFRHCRIEVLKRGDPPLQAFRARCGQTVRAFGRPAVRTSPGARDKPAPLQSSQYTIHARRVRFGSPGDPQQSEALSHSVAVKRLSREKDEDCRLNELCQRGARTRALVQSFHWFNPSIGCSPLPTCTFYPFYRACQWQFRDVADV